MIAAIIDRYEIAKKIALRAPPDCVCFCTIEACVQLLMERGFTVYSFARDIESSLMSQYSDESFSAMRHLGNVVSEPERGMAQPLAYASSAFGMVAELYILYRLIMAKMPASGVAHWYMATADYVPLVQLISGDSARCEVLAPLPKAAVALNWLSAAYFWLVNRDHSHLHSWRCHQAIQEHCAQSLDELTKGPREEERYLAIVADPNLDNVLKPVVRALVRRGKAVDVLAVRSHKVRTADALREYAAIGCRVVLKDALLRRFSKPHSASHKVAEDTLAKERARCNDLPPGEEDAVRVVLHCRERAVLELALSSWSESDRFRSAFMQLVHAGSYRGALLAEHASLHAKVAIEVCRQRSVPLHCLQHGIIACFSSLQYGMGVDCFYAWGQETVDAFRAHNCLRDPVAVVGIPEAPAAGSSTERLPRKYASFLRKPGPVLVWAPNPGSRYYYSVGYRQREVAALLRLARARRDLRVIVKCHTSDRTAYRMMRDFAREPNVRVTNSLPLRTVLPRTDVLLAFNTTAIADAVLMNVPVVAFDCFEQPETVPSISAGIAVPCRDAARLPEVVDSVLAGRLSVPPAAKRRYLERTLRPPDVEDPAEAICDYMVAWPSVGNAALIRPDGEDARG